MDFLKDMDFVKNVNRKNKCKNEEQREDEEKVKEYSYAKSNNTLIQACEFNPQVCLYILLSNNYPDLETVNDNGENILMIACKYDPYIALHILSLNNCPDLKKVNNKGDNVLIIACEFQPNVALCILSLDNCPDLEAINNKGKNALLLACQHHTRVALHILSLHNCPKITNMIFRVSCLFDRDIAMKIIDLKKLIDVQYALYETAYKYIDYFISILKNYKGMFSPKIAFIHACVLGNPETVLYMLNNYDSSELLCIEKTKDIISYSFPLRRYDDKNYDKVDFIVNNIIDQKTSCVTLGKSNKKNV